MQCFSSTYEEQNQLIHNVTEERNRDGERKRENGMLYAFGIQDVVGMWSKGNVCH